MNIWHKELGKGVSSYCNLSLFLCLHFIGRLLLIIEYRTVRTVGDCCSEKYTKKNVKKRVEILFWLLSRRLLSLKDENLESKGQNEIYHIFFKNVNNIKNYYITFLYSLLSCYFFNFSHLVSFLFLCAAFMTKFLCISLFLPNKDIFTNFFLYLQITEIIFYCYCLSLFRFHTKRFFFHNKVLVIQKNTDNDRLFFVHHYSLLIKL